MRTFLVFGFFGIACFLVGYVIGRWHENYICRELCQSCAFWSDLTTKEDEK